MRINEVTASPVWMGSRKFLFVVVGTDEGVWGSERPAMHTARWPSSRVSNARAP
jgi:hypothetical protein